MKKIAFIPMLFMLLTACKKKEPGLASNSTFSLDKFEQNIKNKYGPQTTGYSYAISQYDKVVRYGAGGNARMPNDGQIAYTPETRQELYSVTKFFTAVAVCKVLHAQNKTLSEKVVNYLPTNWTVHASYKDLTFEQLLSHYSGFSMEDRSFDSLKKMMTIPQLANTYNYNNANFALCRILLPYMYYGKNNYKFDELQNLTETSTATDYRTIIRELVLLPAGLTYWNLADFKDWNHEGLTKYKYARYYLWNNPNVASFENSDDYLISGSRGLTLSSYEVAQTLTAFENKQLVNETWINYMKTKKCGFDGSGKIGKHGTYYWKNGSGTNTDGAGAETLIMIFPNGVRVSINSNSHRYLNDLFVDDPDNMVKAFDDAWE
jgi:CubicO group peptidase (beta-lactamase class C family)